MSYTYNQITSSYVYKGVSMKIAGCGECAVASLAYNLRPDKKLHEEVMRYAVDHGYMPAGTTRDGITKLLRWQGLGVEMYSYDCNALFEKIKKTGYGIVLVYGQNKGKANSYWTKGGHYVSITAHEDGKYFVRDSANRRTGWHPISDFKPNFVVGWAVTVPGEPIKATDQKPSVPSPVLKKGDKGVKVGYLQECLNYCMKANLVIDNSWGPATDKVYREWQKQNGLTVDSSYGPKSYDVMFKLLMA